MRKHQRLLYLLLLPGLLTARLAAAQTIYYVDDAGGSDNASGTDPQHAWQTAARTARTQFHAGDKILFRRGGVWQEPLAVGSSGLPGNPVVYGAYGVGPAPLFDPHQAITDGWSSSRMIFSAPVQRAPHTVYADTIKLRHGAGPGRLLPGEWYYDQRAGRLSLRLSRDRNPAGIRVEFPTTGVTVAASGVTDVSLQDLAVAATWDDGALPPGTATGAGIRVDHCRNVEILRCTVTGSRDENVTGIHIAGVPGFVISGCEVSHTLYGILVQPMPQGFPGLIEGCTVHDMDRGTAQEWDGINVGSMDETDFSGLVIRKNDVARFGEDGIDIFYCKNILIEENDIHDSGRIKRCNNQQGIKSIRPGNVFRYNRIWNVGGGSKLPAGFVRNGIVAGGDSTQIYQNLIVSCASYGIIVDSARGARVYNNTVVNCPIAARVQRGASAVLWNNILDRGKEGRSGAYDLDLNGPQTRVSGGYNLLVNSSAAHCTNGARYTGDSTDLHQRDPGFAPFYLPGERSPLIDAGLDLNLHRDGAGRPVPQGKGPDIGAYERPAPGVHSGSR